MAFIAKNWKKNASTNAVNALMRVTGAGVSALALKKLTKNQTTAMQKTIANIAAPVFTLIGLGLDIFTEDPKIRAIGQGMYTFSALKATAVIAPAVGNAIGLSGLDEDENPIMNGIGEIESNPIMNGLNAATSNELTESENPAEFADIQNPNAEGKVWNDVANYIEQGAEQAVEVNGIGDVDEYDEYDETDETDDTIVNGISL